jgi:hypothetical protein
MKIAVCYLNASARNEAKRVARELQCARWEDEVVVFDRVIATAEGVSRDELDKWGADIRVYVSNERRVYCYGS